MICGGNLPATILAWSVSLSLSVILFMAAVGVIFGIYKWIETEW